MEIYGNWGTYNSTIQSRFYAKFDYSSQADANGDIQITNIVIYYQYKNSEYEHTSWRRGTCNLFIGDVESVWYGSATYSDSGNIYYNANIPSKTVHVGTEGGNVTVNLSGTTSFIAGRTIDYTSRNTVTFSVAPYKASYTKGELSVNVSSVTLGESISFSITGGSGVTYDSIRWECGGSTGSTGLNSNGSWTVPINTFEPLIKNSESANIDFVLYSFHDGVSVGYSRSSVTAYIPNNYLPKISIDSFSILDAVNNYIVANKSKLVLRYDTSFEPYGNSATVKNVEVESIEFNPQVSSSVPISVNLQNKTITVGVFSTALGVSSYSASIRIRVTDSRNRTAYVVIDSSYFGRIYAYIPPKVDDIDIYRCNEYGQASPSGKYAYVSLNVDSQSTLEIRTVEINNREYILNGPEKQGKLYAIVGENSLTTNTSYTATIIISNVDMTPYKETIVKTIQLQTMQMPISLYDDGSQVAVSVGEMATRYSGVNTPAVLNFSSLVTLRAASLDGDVITKTPYELLSLSGGGRKIFVQNTTTIPVEMQEGDILIVYED